MSKLCSKPYLLFLKQAGSSGTAGLREEGGVGRVAASLEPGLRGGSPLPKGSGGSLSTGIRVLRMGRGDGVQPCPL